MARSIGIREVAAKAHVSVATVSNVMNKPHLVSAATLAHVQSVMDELGFVRNDLARQLKMGGGTTLGMIVLNVSNPFFGALAHACEEVAESLGHTVVIGSSDQLAVREERYIDLFEEQRVQGLLITPLEGTSARIERLARRGVPVVLFDASSPDGRFCSVALDGAASGKLAAEHLIGVGRRRIAFLGGPLHQVDDRWRGTQTAVAAFPGVALQHIDTADQTIVEGRRAGERILAMRDEERPDAIFAANDLLALGAMQALVLARGIEVPKDIAIVGHDDIDYAASAIVPLTSVRQPLDMLAREAVRLVLQEADRSEGHVHEQVLLSPRLIVRQSSGGR